jgi:hypothetical protein
MRQAGSNLCEGSGYLLEWLPLQLLVQIFQEINPTHGKKLTTTRFPFPSAATAGHLS